MAAAGLHIQKTIAERVRTVLEIAAGKVLAVAEAEGYAPIHGAFENRTDSAKEFQLSAQLFSRLGTGPRATGQAAAARGQKAGQAVYPAGPGAEDFIRHSVSHLTRRSEMTLVKAKMTSRGR